MLTELSIKNLAIIDDLTVSFGPGLTVLSGETGAGKSIIINAVNLILGQRATARLIRTGEEIAEIEALFTVRKDSPVSRIMEANGFAADEDLLVRRIISANDRHKIYVNGKMATIQMLGDITQNLASISGQHANQGLLKEEQHLSWLDQFGNLLELKNRVAEQYGELTPMIQRLHQFEAMEKKRAQQMEFLNFQKSDIENARIIEREDEILEEKRLRLKHGETLRQTVQNTLEELYLMDGSMTERLSALTKNLDKASEMDPQLKNPAGDLTDMLYRIEDISATLRRYAENIETDPALLEETEGRIDALNKLKRKYAGDRGTLADVMTLYDNICAELRELEHLSESIGDLENQIETRHGELTVLCLELSRQRTAAAARFAEAVERELGALDMTKTRFGVPVSQTTADSGTSPWLKVGDFALSETGIDQTRFMLSPNVGEEMRPLAKIASGGELSRVVLALKAILAGVDSVETVIFDEVDAGIGGRIAEMVGQKIKALSGHHQIVCITHLPQIAKYADHHYKIEKHVDGGRTRTGIRPIEGGERVHELARMLGGVTITDKTLEHAREMLEMP
jgi:DNA repair protein RecN (Recombination protein N)